MGQRVATGQITLTIVNDGAPSVMYRIVGSVNTVTRSMTGELSVTSVKCYVYKITGDTGRELTAEKTLRMRRVTASGAQAPVTVAHAQGVTADIAVTADTERIEFSLYDSDTTFDDTTLLDCEEVAVVADASDMELGGVNLLRNSGERFEKAIAANGDHFFVLTDRTVYMEQGGVYTISGRTNGIFTNNHLNDRTQGYVVLWICSLASSPQGVVNAIVSGADMTSDGRKGHTFTWNHPTGTYFLRINYYAVGTWWVEKVKIERGNVTTDWSPSPDDIEKRVDTFDYIKAAMADGASQFNGGLMLSSLIRLGMWDKTNPDNPVMSAVYAGMNGIYSNLLGGRTIASWWGGDMIDRFDANDNRLNEAGKRYATALVRMDGSFYFANGNIGGRPDGSGWVAGDSITWNKDGVLTLGTGIKIDITGTPGLAETIQSILNFNAGITSLLVPCDAAGIELKGGWQEAFQHDGSSDPKAIKAKSLKALVDFWGVGGITALGLGSGSASGGGTGGAVDLFIGPWSSYTEAANGGEAVSGKAGKELYDLIQTSAGSLSALTARTAALEGKNYLDELTLAQAGSGNAVTAVALSADKKTLTVTKGTTFLTAITKAMVEAVLTGNITSHTHSQYLTAHQSLANYVRLDGSQTITGQKTFKTEQHFATGDYADPWAGTVCAIKATGKIAATDSVKAASFIKAGGTASQFLMADGSVMTKKVLTNLGNVGWDSSGNATSDLIVPTMSFMAYWDGSYNGSTSNLRYCDRGRFGTIVTKNVADYVLSTAYTAADVLSKLKTVDGSGSGLDADTVDGVHLNGLLTAFSRTGAINNTLSLTVGGVTKTAALYPMGSWGMRYESKPDNGGRPVVLLIADITAWMSATSSSSVSHYGFTGRITETRTSGYMGEKITDVICRTGYSHSTDFFGALMLRTSNPAYVKPRIISYNGSYYLGLEVTGSGHGIMFEGYFYGWMQSVIALSKDASGNLPTGASDITSSYTTYDFMPYNAQSATKLLTARAINGTAFDGTGAITTALWGTAREMKITDATGANSGVAVSVNGSAAVALKLPATIAAALSGNASTATRLQGAFSLWGQSFYGNNVSGNMTGVGNITAAGEIRVTHTYPNIAVLRACNDNYGVMQRIDSTGYHFLLTDSGNPTGTFNDLRPLSIQLATGMVSLGGDVMTVGDTVTVKNKIILKHANGKTAELSIDENGVVHVSSDFVATGGVTALATA